MTDWNGGFLGSKALSCRLEGCPVPETIQDG